MRSIFFLYIHITSLTQQLCNHSLQARTHFRNSKSVIAIIRGCCETAQSTAVPALWYFGFSFLLSDPVCISVSLTHDKAWDMIGTIVCGVATRIDNRVMSSTPFLLLARNNFQEITCYICFIIDILIILKNDILIILKNGNSCLRFYLFSLLRKKRRKCV